jgi:hypothetical protein
MSYVVALALTLTIEIPITVGILRFWLRVPPRQSLLPAIAGNLVTHPMVWFITPIIPAAAIAPDLTLTIAEVLAMMVEAIIMRARVPRSFSALLIVSFLANAASLLVGSAII